MQVGGWQRDRQAVAVKRGGSDQQRAGENGVVADGPNGERLRRWMRRTMPAISL